MMICPNCGRAPLDCECEPIYRMHYFHPVIGKTDPLGAPFDRVLQDNLWDLYIRSDADLHGAHEWALPDYPPMLDDVEF